ncbi:hypothetical protein C8J57DRAFT_1262167 [Mycena rebaudengoi]|nr:hypothetical protein C8J57DRAFT_1262167 [Mycena rebaudengoi]
MGATVAPTITPVEILREENEQLADVEVADPEIPDEEVEDSLWIEEDVEIELDEFLPPLYPDCQLEPVSCGSARKSDSQKDSRTSATLLKKPVDTSEASSISAELGGCQSTERDRRAEAIGCIRETRVQDKIHYAGSLVNIEEKWMPRSCGAHQCFKLRRQCPELYHTKW